MRVHGLLIPAAAKARVKEDGEHGEGGEADEAGEHGEGKEGEKVG